MSNVSSITLSGNLTRDPEQKSVGGGRTLVEFTVANTRWNKRSREEFTTFYRVTVWQEHMQSRLLAKAQKGTGVTVVGDYDPVPRDDGGIFHNITQPSVELGARQRSQQEATHGDMGRHGATRQQVDNHDDVPF